ncbi:MAG: TIGR03668 family PPOX class F420-dependent oxidoreductase [Chloroflexota bacterium]
MAPPIMSSAERAFVAAGRTATLATLDPEGQPRLVPICFVVGADDRMGRALVYTPIDEKPKSSPDPRRLARVRDLLILPAATLLVDRWDEDWSRLAWVRLYGRAEILEPQPHEVEEHAAAVAALREKYAQYRTHALENRPIIRIAVDRVRSWGELG